MSDKIPEKYHHQDFGLKRGTKAYLVFSPEPYILEVIIKGKCSASEGHGYNAWAAITDGAGGNRIGKRAIHTCNGYLTTSIKKARWEVLLEMAKEKDRVVSNIGSLNDELNRLYRMLEKGPAGVRLVKIKEKKR